MAGTGVVPFEQRVQHEADRAGVGHGGCQGLSVWIAARPLKPSVMVTSSGRSTR